MRAMVYRGPYRVRVEEKPRPRIEHPNDAWVLGGLLATRAVRSVRRRVR